MKRELTFILCVILFLGLWFAAIKIISNKLATKPEISGFEYVIELSVKDDLGNSMTFLMPLPNYSPENEIIEMGDLYINGQKLEVIDYEVKRVNYDILRWAR